MRVTHAVLDSTLVVGSTGTAVQCSHSSSTESVAHAQVARKQWHTPKYVLDRADVEGRQHCTRPLIQHGNALLLHTAAWCQADWFKGAEEYQ